MKPALPPLLASLRLRLTLFLALALGLIIWGYALLVSQKLQNLARERVEARLEAAAMRWIPARAPRMDLPRLPASDGDPEVPGVLFGAVAPDGSWQPLTGRWPSALVEAWQRWWEDERAGLGAVALPIEAVPGDAEEPVLGRRQPPPEPFPEGERGKFRVLEIVVDEAPWMLLTARVGETYAVFGYNMTEERAVARDLGRVQAFYLPAVVSLVLLVAWVFASRALRPVRQLGSAMAKMSGRHLGENLPTAGMASEFRDLVTVFNAMSRRLQRSFQQASRFGADAAHELRTPLTVLQAELESALQAEVPGSERQRQLSSMLEEVQRLKGIIDRLLLLARADAGSLLGTRTPCAVDEIAREMLGELAEAHPEIEFETRLRPAWVEGDPVLLSQAFSNVLGNAVKYNRPGGWISVLLREEDGARGRVVCEIANAGEPVPAEVQGHLFERFFRTDAARSRRVDGVGLGLSLSREIARAHGGDLVLLQSDREQTLFRLELPCRPVPPGPPEGRSGGRKVERPGSPEGW